MAAIQKKSVLRKSAWKGQALHVTLWEPATSPTALLYLCHGVCEHMGRYDALASSLAAEGILVFGHDHVGHGQSEGDRVHIERYEQYVQDVIQTIEETKSRFATLPCYLMGHSMGGLIAGLVAIERQDWFKGLILSAPFVETEVGWFFQKASKVIAFAAPQLGVKSIPTDTMSSILEVVQTFVEDDLVYHGAIKSKWCSASFAAIAMFKEQVSRIELPLLLIHGTEDTLVPISASEFVAANATSQQIRFEKLDGSRHDVFHDKDKERAIATVKEWILNLC